MIHLRSATTSVLIATLIASTALGAPKRPAPRGEAPAHDARKEKAARISFDKAERAFNLGKFDEALTAYETAYEQLPLPAFLFNIAQCYRNLGNHERAAFFYQRYLSLDPDAPNRAVVEELVEEQREAMEVARVAASANTATPAPGSPPNLNATAPASEDRSFIQGQRSDVTDRGEVPIHRRWWPWAMVGGVVAAGLVAGLMLSGGGSSALPTGKLGFLDCRNANPCAP
jgi:tetratricopeptide (TPR) repeat protein